MGFDHEIRHGLGAAATRARMNAKESILGEELCPRCEDGVLKRVEASHPLRLGTTGATVRIPGLYREECRHCGFASLSGREVALVEIVLARSFESVASLVAMLEAAGARDLFLRESEEQEPLTFGHRDYVETLDDDLGDLYLDHEASHALKELAGVEGITPVDLPSGSCRISLPQLGEGENGVVYACPDRPEDVFKIAKPRPYSRRHLLEEIRLTELFDRAGIKVPAIRESDAKGSYLFKEKLGGISLSVAYESLGPSGSPKHERVKDAVKELIGQLLELFEKVPEAKTSFSPNNIFVEGSPEDCHCLLIDTGPAPLHDYSDFDFDHYWNEEIPRKIEQYRRVGYL